MRALNFIRIAASTAAWLVVGSFFFAEGLEWIAYFCLAASVTSIFPRRQP